MCELLVRVKDKVNDDPLLDVGCTKRGDVIAVCPDDHSWGRMELKNPEWRIVKMPGVSVEKMEFLLAPEHPPDLLKEYKMLRKRSVKLDLDALGIATDPDEKPTTERIDIRGEPIDAIVKVVSTEMAAKDAAIVKQRLPEPDIIGPKDEGIIGPK